MQGHDCCLTSGDIVKLNRDGFYFPSLSAGETYMHIYSAFEPEGSYMHIYSAFEPEGSYPLSKGSLFKVEHRRGGDVCAVSSLGGSGEEPYFSCHVSIIAMASPLELLALEG